MNSTHLRIASVLHSRRNIGSAILLAAIFCCLTSNSARAGSATWVGSHGSEWEDSDNWNPQTVPNSPDDTATFAVSNVTLIYVDFPLEVNGIIFAAGASSFDFHLVDSYGWSFTGVGITNNSGQVQTFDVSDADSDDGEGFNIIEFSNSATAGDLTQFIIQFGRSEDDFAAILSFGDSATAGSAAIENQGGFSFENGGTTYFNDDSSADHATITNDGGDAVIAGGTLFFDDNSTAGHATIINSGAIGTKGGSGTTQFDFPATCGDSTIICNGGTEKGFAGGLVSFLGGERGISSPRGKARIVLMGNGAMNISQNAQNSPPSVGSIEGDGNIAMTGVEVGTNNRSTTFTGQIQGEGALTKVGRGVLTLTGANTYSAGTTVRAGELRISNPAGSGTGTGAVKILHGTLSGSGIIAGDVRLGGASGPSAILAPGLGIPGVATLTLEKALTFKATGQYVEKVDTKAATADTVIAKHVTITPAAQFSLRELGHATLPVGTVFTAISNTGSEPIAGNFANLPDGAKVTLGKNTFQASYEGGDGNDLTLTVVP